MHLAVTMELPKIIVNTFGVKFFLSNKGKTPHFFTPTDLFHINFSAVVGINCNLFLMKSTPTDNGRN